MAVSRLAAVEAYILQRSLPLIEQRRRLPRTGLESPFAMLRIPPVNLEVLETKGSLDPDGANRRDAREHKPSTSRLMNVIVPVEK